MAMKSKTYPVDRNTVDTVSAEIQDYLNQLGVERRNIQRIRLTVEEILLNILENHDSPREISIMIGKQFGHHILRLRYTGEMLDPIRYNSENSWSEDLMRNLGYSPAWSYKRGVNTVSLVLHERSERSRFLLSGHCCHISGPAWPGRQPDPVGTPYCPG